MSIKVTLLTVLGKLVPQAMNVSNARKQAQDTLEQADAGAVAAAKVLIEKFGNPQGAAQILQSVYQVDALKETLDEINTMIASIQATIDSPEKLVDADLQLAANNGVANSPLPQSGPGSVVITESDAGSSSEAAPGPSEAVDQPTP